MAEAYSNDLRRKFFQAYDRGEGSPKELAKRFGVSEDRAKKLSARRSKTGQIVVRAWRHGPQSRVTAAMREWINQQMRRQPDLTLQELQQRLEREQRLHLSVDWIWILLRRWELRHKKSLRAQEQWSRRIEHDQLFLPNFRCSGETNQNSRMKPSLPVRGE